MEKCKCQTPPFHYTDYETIDLGIDEQDGRYGEVSIEKCKVCGSTWLRYFVEYEAFNRSGRWYRGALPEKMIQGVTPENAAQILATLEPRYAGGSYFDSTGFLSTGPLRLGL